MVKHLIFYSKEFICSKLLITDFFIIFNTFISKKIHSFYLDVSLYNKIDLCFLLLHLIQIFYFESKII